MDIRADTSFEWKFDAGKNQSYLLKKCATENQTIAPIESVPDELLTQPPRPR